MLVIKACGHYFVTNDKVYKLKVNRESGGEPIPVWEFYSNRADYDPTLVTLT